MSPLAKWDRICQRMALAGFSETGLVKSRKDVEFIRRNNVKTGKIRSYTIKLSGSHRDVLLIAIVAALVEVEIMEKIYRHAEVLVRPLILGPEMKRVPMKSQVSISNYIGGEPIARYSPGAIYQQALK